MCLLFQPKSDVEIGSTGVTEPQSVFISTGCVMAHRTARTGTTRRAAVRLDSFFILGDSFQIDIIRFNYIHIDRSRQSKRVLNNKMINKK